MTRPTIAITIGQAHYGRMFNGTAWRTLDAFADVIHHPGQEPADKAALLSLLPQADACITSWDVAALDADVLAAAPRLRAMAHMGGSVKRFVSEAVWTRGVHVTSAASALARDVAETTVGLMIVGAKRIWPLGQQLRAGGWRESPAWPSRETPQQRGGPHRRGERGAPRDRTPAPLPCPGSALRSLRERGRSRPPGCGQSGASRIGAPRRYRLTPRAGQAGHAPPAQPRPAPGHEGRCGPHQHGTRRARSTRSR